MAAYYNEHDPFAAAWLRNLITAGHIAPGEVDERSIEDVTPDDLRSFTQCHFFAGIGVWSYALRLAQWPDDRPIWTGSCPCQPFSTAGKGDGFADERHLWPAWHHLIVACRPSIIVGEQVASKDGLVWLDLVRADMEATGYAFGAADMCAAGFGAPHIRQRSWFVALADDDGNGLRASRGIERNEPERNAKFSRTIIGMADPSRSGSGAGLRHSGSPEQRWSVASNHGSVGRMADDDDARLPQQRRDPGVSCGTCATDAGQGVERTGAPASPALPGPTNGFWRDADWLACRDGRWRPVEPGTFPLAHGATNRVGRLRGYGNAIVAPVAQAFIEVVMSVTK